MPLELVLLILAVVLATAGTFTVASGELKYREGKSGYNRITVGGFLAASGFLLLGIVIGQHTKIL